MSDHSFPALGFDPAPGDTTALDSLAADCSRFGGELTDDVNILTSLQNGFLWSGPAAEAFLKVVQIMPKDLQNAAAGYTAAGKAIYAFSGDLVGYQSRARDLETQASQYVTAAATPPTPSAQPGPAPTPPGSPPPGPPPKTPQQIASGHLDDLRAQARTLRASVQDSANTANAILNSAASTAPHKPGWLSSAWHSFTGALKDFSNAVGDFVRKHATIIKWIADLASKISSVLTIAAALCAFVPVLGEFADAVLVPLALATGAVALVGHTLLAAYAGGSWTDVGLDAAGLVTGGLGKVIGRVGEAGETGVKAVDGVENATKTGGTAAETAVKGGTDTAESATGAAGKTAEDVAKPTVAQRAGQVVKDGAGKVKDAGGKVVKSVKEDVTRDIKEAKEATHDVLPKNFKGAFNEATKKGTDYTGKQLARKVISYQLNFPAVGLAGNDLAHSGETGQDAGEGVDKVNEAHQHQQESQLGPDGVLHATPRVPAGHAQ